MLLLYHVGNTLLSTPEVHKLFAIVDDYSDLNSDTFFKAHKRQNCYVFSLQSAIVLALNVWKRNKVIYRNTHVDGWERM